MLFLPLETKFGTCQQLDYLSEVIEITHEASLCMILFNVYVVMSSACV